MMKIEKITNKVNLDGVVVAEFDKFKCNNDCVTYHYSGKSAAKGCARYATVGPKMTKKF